MCKLPTFVIIFILLFTFACSASPDTQANSRSDSNDVAEVARLDFYQVFLFLFITLGPLKILAPFIRITKNAEPRFAREIALRAWLISTISIFVTAVTGEIILSKWKISLVSLLLTAGIILIVVAFQMEMKLYQYDNKPPTTILEPTMEMAVSPLAYPIIITPYGIAILVIIMAASTNLQRQISILGILMLVMILNLLAMLLARQIIRLLSNTFLSIVGVVLGVLQMALGINIILLALSKLGVVSF